MLKVFYSENQTAKSNDSYSPSAQKPALVVDSWMKTSKPFELCDFLPVTRSDLKLIHEPSYVDGVLDLKTLNGFGNKNRDVATALPWVAGSMVAATLDALKNKSITISPTSGAHHATYIHGSAFCTFNFLVLAALKAHHSGARKVGIIDLDCHYGNGTDDIVKTLNLNFINHYTFGGDGLSRSRITSWLDSLPEKVMGFRDCDIVLYNAGVDSHIDDPLGGLLTTEQMRQRDFCVLKNLHDLNIPIAISLAGGYQKDKQGGISKVLELHGLMFDIAWELSQTKKEVIL